MLEVQVQIQIIPGLYWHFTIPILLFQFYHRVRETVPKPSGYWKTQPWAGGSCTRRRTPAAETRTPLWRHGATFGGGAAGSLSCCLRAARCSRGPRSPCSGATGFPTPGPASATACGGTPRSRRRPTRGGPRTGPALPTRLRCRRGGRPWAWRRPCGSGV